MSDYGESSLSENEQAQTKSEYRGARVEPRVEKSVGIGTGQANTASDLAEAASEPQSVDTLSRLPGDRPAPSHGQRSGDPPASAHPLEENG